MAREDLIQAEGTIIRVLPRSLFWVELENGHRVLAHLAARERAASAGLKLGDRVMLQMTPFDLAQGRILVPDENKQIGYEGKSIGKETL